MRAAVYQAIARGDFWSDPYSLAAQLAEIFHTPVETVMAIIQAIISGVNFLGDKPNPHYSPYDLTGGINWMRGRLKSTVGQSAVRAATCWSEADDMAHEAVQELGNDWIPDPAPAPKASRNAPKKVSATAAARSKAVARKAVKVPAKKRAPKPA